MSMSDLFNKASVQDDGSDFNQNDTLNIIDFIESPYGLGFSEEVSQMSLYPVQKFILKAYYGLPLEDSEKTIRIPKSWRKVGSAKPDHYYEFTEKGYMEYLFNEGRCNVKEPDHDRHELILPLGRRSGKSLLSSMIAAYEVYNLLRKGNPQRYYGLKDGGQISVSSVATTKKQAGIFYKEVRNHFSTCDFFDPYLSHDTQSYVNFQTPYDMEKTGDVDDGGRSSIQITFFSSSSSGLRGLANKLIVLDEVAFFKSKGSSSADAVYQAAAPSTANFSPADPNNSQENVSSQSEGRIVMISSPFTREGLFYDKYEQSRAGGEGAEDLLMIQAPTWEVNPTIGKRTLANSHGKDPGAFATEFGAQFTDRVRSWIEREEDLQVCINKDIKAMNKGGPRIPHSLGLDIAAVDDRTAAVLTRPEGDQVRMVYHELWQAGENWYDLNPHLEEPFFDYARELHCVEKLDLEAIAQWITELTNRFYVKQGLMDQWSGISIHQSLEKLGVDQIDMKQFTKNETSQMFNAFKQLMYHGRLQLYDYTIRDVETDDEEEEETSLASNRDHSPYIKELLDLQAEKKSKKNIDVHAPNVGYKYDDFADALVRSIWLSIQQSNKNNHISGKRAEENKVGSKNSDKKRRKSRFKNYRNKRRPNGGMNPRWRHNR